MTALLPWARIVVGIGVYMVFAIAASIIVEKTGEDLKEMEGRTSQTVLILGAVANLLVLAATVLLLVLWVGLPVSALGFSFSSQDLVVSIVGVVALIGLAVSLIVWLNHTGRFQVEVTRPLKDSAGAAGLIVAVLVLFIVAVQEEVLYRGYITLNLLDFEPALIIIVSTGFFTAIHLLTNRASFYQILGWLILGAVFSYVYLISGSIWVPIVLHFAIDLTNLLVFDIVGQHSLFTIKPDLTSRYRAVHRISYGVVQVAILLALLGPEVRIG